MRVNKQFEKPVTLINKQRKKTEQTYPYKLYNNSVFQVCLQYYQENNHQGKRDKQKRGYEQAIIT